MIMVDGAWNPKEGAWSLYRITNLHDKSVSTMHFATLRKTSYEGRAARWVEVDVTSHNQDRAVTRILAEETAAGLGKILEVIVQPKGYDPFTVPQSMLDSAEGPENDLHRIKAVKKGRDRYFKFKGKRFGAYEVKGKDEKGRTVSATVSQFVAPLGLVKAITPDTEMRLIRFGDGAKSRIKGEPVNFYIWITQQILHGISES